MENEIDLREIIQVLWRGKYLILAVTAVFTIAVFCYIYFIVTPVYKSTGLLDLSLYHVKGKDIITLIEQNQVVKDALKDLTVEPDLLAQSITVSALPDHESVLQVEVKYAEPEICVNAMKQTGVAIIQTVSRYGLEQINLEKERIEKLIAFLDKAIEEYLLSRDDRVAELLEDPVYKRLLEEKASFLVELELLNFDLTELTEKKAVDADHWLNSQSDTARPVYVNKKAYVAIAVLLGLMLSTLIIFIRNYLLIGAPTSRDLSNRAD